MAPARRLRSAFARLLRYLADAVQPPVDVPAVPAVPAAEDIPEAAGAGNEHWLALVRERAPELLTGGGIHAGGAPPDHRAAAAPQRRPPAPAETRRSTVRTDIYATPQDNSQRQFRAPPFATFRVLRRRFRTARGHPPKPAARATLQSESTEQVSTGSAHSPHPDISTPTSTKSPATPAEFDAARHNAATADTVEGGLTAGGRAPQREPVARLAPNWPVTPPALGVGPEFDQQEHRAHAALDEWPPLASTARRPDVPPDFTLAVARVSELPAWPDERHDDNRWPELPDDDILWEPPISGFDSANLRRLDDEQRGW